MRPRTLSPSQRDLEAINKLIDVLKNVEFKLRIAINNLKAKERHYWQQCCHSLAQKDELKAFFCASMVAGVRMALMLTSRIEACVVELKVRLISYRELIVIWDQVGQSVPLVEELAKKIESAMPWISRYIEELRQGVEALRSPDLQGLELNLEVMSENIKALPIVPAVILKEAREAIKKQTAEGFPVPPTSAETAEEQAEAVALSSNAPASPNPADIMEKALSQLSGGGPQSRGEGGRAASNVEDMLFSDEELRDALRRLRTNGRW